MFGRKPPKRPLPTGVKEFHEWSDRIIVAANILATTESQKYVLANVIVNTCTPDQAFETDQFFINYLRKYSANQVAIGIRDEIYAKRKAKKEQNQAAASADPVTSNGEVLALPGIQKP